MQKLNINQFPLTGQSLIEASAGTGKTFTITALYNRLLLAHNTELPRLGCDQILVVTFTRAATEELRGRIRDRIRDSFEECLRLQNNSAVNDAGFAQQLTDIGVQSEGVNDYSQLMELTTWLQANLAQMDEASIFTIHGFCQRMLKQFAFDSGVMFDAELVLDSETYLQQACEDIWRLQCYHLDSDQGRFLLNRYAGPDALLHKFRSWLSRPHLKFIPQPQESEFAEQWQSLKSQYQAIQQSWQQLGSDNLQQLLTDSGVDKRSYSSRNLPRWLEKVGHYLTGEFYLPVPGELEKFSRRQLEEKTKRGEPPQHPLFDLIEDYCQQSQQLGLQLDIAWYQQVRDRYFYLLEQAAALTPDDLLRLLATALQGEQGDQLAAQIRTSYPVAMIDEFQDTDPQQYEIFNRIYPAVVNENKTDSGEAGSNSNAYGLYMIGDPKQAIYGFRGADIFTYMQARRSLSDQQRYTLHTNWRSHSQLIDAVNSLWQQHNSPFVFDKDIDFVAVNAAGKHDHNALTLAGESPQPMQLWLSDDSLSRAEGHSLAAEQCAQQIAALIRSEQAKLGDQPVQAKDIAVLVRSRRQAGWIRDALSEKQIGSVFLTRDSVFDSQEAIDLLAWLNALLNPSDERLIRTALATKTQGLNAATLDAMLNNESRWEQELEKIQSFQWHWKKRGIMAAMMLWLESPLGLTDQDDMSLAVRLKQSPQGERCLTNILHLGELLQSASRRLRGQQGLVRWFGERIFDPERNGEEAQLRLETDANLVTIVTIHKSKGLEYPLVFLPFLWDDSFIPHQLTEAQYYLGYNEEPDSDEVIGESAGVVLNLAPDSDEKELAIRDIKAEYLRLLYVALTRAKYGCYIWLMDVVDGRSKKSALYKSAIGYLLQLGSAASREPIDWQQMKDAFSDSSRYVGSMPIWQQQLNTSAQTDSDKTAVQAKIFTSHLYDSWRVSSYSQLAGDHSAPHVQTDVADSPDWQDDDLQLLDWEAQQDIAGDRAAVDVAGLEGEVQQAQNYALSFPKGANPGTCLHGILEHWDFNDSEALIEICSNQLQYYGLSDCDEQQLGQWLTQVVNTPLLAHEQEFNLSQLTQSQRLDEMEFYLPLGNGNQMLTPAKINALIDGKKLSFDALNGYLKGFIDLIFIHNGRYYVADYKSNHLGYEAADYSHEQLALSMADHDYDLQAWIYTLALDRLLQQRLAGYDPEQHLGGVFYFYLRGMIDEFHDAELPVMQSPLSHQPLDLFTDDADDFSNQQTAFDTTQKSGVFYQAVDLQQLQRWRDCFFAFESSDSNNGGCL